MSEAVLEGSDASPEKVADEEEKKVQTKLKGNATLNSEKTKPYIEPTIKIVEEKRAELYAKRIHPVNGYNDAENMWHKIANIDSPSFSNSNKFQNKRSMFLC